MHNAAAHLLTICLLSASKATHIPPDIIMSIIMVEGGRSGTETANKNGSLDLGVMQINTKTWLRLISDTLYDGNKNLAYKTLRDNSCINIKIGSWILSKSIQEANGDIWAGVGLYHSHRQEIARPYIEKVKSVHYNLFIK